MLAAYPACAGAGDAPRVRICVGVGKRGLGHNPRHGAGRIAESNVMKNHRCQLSRGASRRGSRLLLAALGIVVLSVAMDSQACETDADCRVGGTCIKREKRASGVCYGGAPRGEASADKTPVLEVPSKPVTGERREHAKAWLGDPEQLLKEHLPGKEVGGTCMVTQDCAAGFDCVIAGFEGHCVKL